MFNLSKYAGPRRIKDRGIKWTEHYREKSDNLKKRFDKTIGPGSYYRWEGHDYTSDGDYFIIVGPSITKEGRKRFFAGIKRYPKDPEKKQFAPYGEYFPNIISALSHASQKWAIPFPKNQVPYGEAVLANIKIPRHLRGSDNSVIKEAGDMKKIISKVAGLFHEVKTNDKGTFDVVHKSSGNIAVGDVLEREGKFIMSKLDQNMSEAVYNGGDSRTMGQTRKIVTQGYSKKVSKVAGKGINPAIKRSIGNKIVDLTQGYHEQIPLGPIFDVLKANGIQPVQEDATDWSGMFVGGAECGSDETANQVANIDLVTADTREPLNSSLYISWCVMPSGSYEVVSYIS